MDFWCKTCGHDIEKHKLEWVRCDCGDTYRDRKKCQHVRCDCNEYKW